ncbi:MAG: tryptophan 2,3-dioxygenase, partial [Myxococcota bacterium]
QLKPASGFQSVQFREVEYLCGVKDLSYIKYFKNTPASVARLEKRASEPDLRGVFYAMLRDMGFAIPEDVSKEHLDEDEGDRDALLAALVPLYQNPDQHLALNLLAESLVSLDQWIGLWREHHVRVVERIIGHKHGTGGSSGVDYLRSTTTKRAFPHLFSVRTQLKVQP